MKKKVSKTPESITNEIMLHTHHELLRKFFLNTHFLIVYMDPGFFILRVNKAFADAGSQPPDFFIGKNFFDLYPDKEKKQVFRNTVISQNSHSSYSEIFNFPNHPEQKKVYMDFTLHPTISKTGQTDGLVLVLIDVTDRKKTEDELLRAQKQLSEEKQLIQIGKLAAIIAHELRNPLAVIEAAAYNITELTQDPQILNHLKTIEKKISESDRFIYNILSYSRIEKPRMKMVYPVSLINDCISSVKKEHPDSHVNITKDFRFSGETTLLIDPLQIKQVIINILNNSYQSFSGKKGDISIIAEKETPLNFTIRITDNGEGIEKDILDNIYDPFFTTKPDGTGLGLSICKEIINLHNGEIKISSDKNTGTEVSIRLHLT